MNGKICIDIIKKKTQKKTKLIILINITFNNKCKTKGTDKKQIIFSL